MTNNTVVILYYTGGWTNGTYKVAYAISKNVFGPFERVSTILEADETTPLVRGIIQSSTFPTSMNGTLFTIGDRSQTLTATTG